MLGLDFASAERLKILYSHVADDCPSLTLDLIIYDQEKTIDALLLNEVVKARMTETLSLVKAKYEQRT